MRRVASGADGRQREERVAVLVVAIDPGPAKSALVLWDGESIRHHAYLVNAELVRWMADQEEPWPLAIEMIANMGMQVGKEVFETCTWIGRFEQAWGGLDDQDLCDRLTRNQVKMHLCQSTRAKDKNIRAALIDRFGGPGRKCAVCKGKGWTGRDHTTCPACDGGGWKIRPGAAAELVGDEWSAFAVAVTWWETVRVKQRRSA